MRWSATVSGTTAPPKTDKDGVWVPANVEKAPRLVARAQEPGANIGRCRVIELQPNSYADSIYNLHRDDNNRLNPEGTGWIVRGFFNLTDNPDSVMILREDRDDPSTETRIPLPAGTQAIIDTQRLWHAVWHPGTAPRYCLITSWESGAELGAYIDKYNGVPTVASLPLSADVIAAAQAEVTGAGQSASPSSPRPARPTSSSGPRPDPYSLPAATGGLIDSSGQYHHQTGPQ